MLCNLFNGFSFLLGHDESIQIMMSSRSNGEAKVYGNKKIETKIYIHTLYLYITHVIWVNITNCVI